METHRSNGTLSVSDVRELSAANAGSFRDEVCALLAPEIKNIEIDLSQTSLVDSCGLGALVSVHNAAKGHDRNGGVRMRLLNPSPSVQQVLELTRLHQFFDMVSTT